MELLAAIPIFIFYHNAWKKASAFLKLKFINEQIHNMYKNNHVLSLYREQSGRARKICPCDAEKIVQLFKFANS